MSLEHAQKWCPTCQRYVMVQRPGANHILHLLLTLFTCGIWLLVWLGQSVRMGGWRCPWCGTKC